MSNNIVILIGNAGKDAEVRPLNNGAKVAKFSFATNETWKDKDTGERRQKTQWHNVVAWRNWAEFAERFVKKGKALKITGSIEYRKTTSENGETKYYTDIVASHIGFLPNGGGESNNESNYSAPAKPQPKPAPEPVAADAEGGDLPF